MSHVHHSSVSAAVSQAHREIRQEGGDFGRLVRYRDSRQRHPEPYERLTPMYDEHGNWWRSETAYQRTGRFLSAVWTCMKILTLLFMIAIVVGGGWYLIGYLIAAGARAAQ